MPLSERKASMLKLATKSRPFDKNLISVIMTQRVCEIPL